MTSYLTHPLNKRTRPNLTDMFDNGRLDKYTETGQFDPVVLTARIYFTDQDFRRIVNKADVWGEDA